MQQNQQFNAQLAQRKAIADELAKLRTGELANSQARTTLMGDQEARIQQGQDATIARQGRQDQASALAGEMAGAYADKGKIPSLANPLLGGEVGGAMNQALAGNRGRALATPLGRSLVGSQARRTEAATAVEEQTKRDSLRHWQRLQENAQKAGLDRQKPGKGGEPHDPNAEAMMNQRLLDYYAAVGLTD